MGGGLSGKWVWIWNLRRCEGGDIGRIATRLKAAGCAGALVKAFDGGYWFDQGKSFRDVCRGLKAHGLSVAGWGYLYGRDPASEAQRAIETATYGEADVLMLDVESEFKDRPGVADDVCRRIRAGAGGGYPVYFSSFAIARYHRSFPFEQFRRATAGTAPQVYWNAFRWPMGQSMDMTYADYAAMGIPPSAMHPVAGVYKEGYITYPLPHEVREFVRQAGARGSPGVSFWSYEHMDESMWEAVASASLAGEDGELSSQEYQQLSRQIEIVGARVDSLAAQVAAINGGGAPPATPRRYTVQPGDTLSGIAAKLGLNGWQRLYDVNRGVIGGDPNLIRPGQVLVVP
jgi:LysM repeat protein